MKKQSVTIFTTDGHVIHAGNNANLYKKLDAEWPGFNIVDRVTFAKKLERYSSSFEAWPVNLPEVEPISLNLIFDPDTYQTDED